MIITYEHTNANVRLFRNVYMYVCMYVHIYIYVYIIKLVCINIIYYIYILYIILVDEKVKTSFSLLIKNLASHTAH